MRPPQYGIIRLTVNESSGFLAPFVEQKIYKTTIQLYTTIVLCFMNEVNRCCYYSRMKTIFLY